jgi:hypothetical protein
MSGPSDDDGQATDSPAIHPLIADLYQRFRASGGELDEAYLEELRDKLTTSAKSPMEVFHALQSAHVFLTVAMEHGHEGAALAILGWMESFEPYFEKMDELGLLPDVPEGIRSSNMPLQAPNVGDKPRAGMLSLRDLMPPKKIR